MSLIKSGNAAVYAVLLIFGAQVLATLAVVGGVGYVLFHFIHKLW